jgi:hypothetical protein
MGSSKGGWKNMIVEKKKKKPPLGFWLVGIVCVLTHQSLIKQQQRIKMLDDTCSYFSPWAKLP